MYFRVEQISNSLYGAEFIIIGNNEEKIGNAVVTGKVGTMEANIQINLLNSSISLKYGYKNIKEAIQSSFGKGIFRPYEVIIDNKETGRIGTQYIKQGMLTKIAVKELTLDEIKFENYFYGLGKEGKVYSIYTSETQVAQINKSNEVIDGLHKYEVKCIQDKYIIATVIQCLYTYVFTDYRPGEKVTEAKEVKIIQTTNEFLKSKYNPEFWEKNN